MILDFNEEQKILSRSAHEFLSKECPKELSRQRRNDNADINRGLWQQMADLGWMGVSISEEYEGSGGDFGDLSVLLEAMGAACLPLPFFSTAVVCANALQLSNAEALKAKLLPQIASGKLIASYALIDPGNTYGLDNIQAQAVATDDGFTLSGSKLFVEYAGAADYLLTVAISESSGLVLAMVKADSAGVEIETHATLDYADQCEVRFDKVAVPGSAVLATGDEAKALLHRIEDIAAVAKCAEILGGIQAVLEMSVDYVKQREQFGQRIGSFQSIQHHCANMAVEVDSARYITRQAIWKIAHGEAATKEASMAKSYASTAAVRVAKLGHQTHGAISFCDELDMHLYLRRAHAASVAFGGTDYHLEKVAQQLGL